MKTENLSTLKIHRLTQAQYDRELEAGRIDENALYLTPDEAVDLSGLATVAYVDSQMQIAANKGAIREFNSNVINGQSFTYAGITSNFYTVTYMTTNQSKVYTMIVEYSAVANGYHQYAMEDGGTLTVQINGSSIVFSTSSESHMLITICGYY